MSITIDLIDRLNKMLKDDSEGYDSTINFLFQVMDQTFDNYNYDKSSLQNNVVSLVGTTGGGKSTLLNYLAGVKLRVINIDGLTLGLEVWNKDDSVASIGSGQGLSQTIYPNIYDDKTNGLVYLDNPGDSDSRGISQQILNSYIKYRIGDNIHQIQFLIVSSYSSLVDSNGTQLVTYLNQFVKTLAVDEELLKNISIVLTKTPYRKNTTQQVIIERVAKLRGNQKANLSSYADELLGYIIENKKVGIFFQPTQEMENQQYQNPSKDSLGLDNKGTGKDIINMLKASSFYKNILGQKLFKLTVNDLATVNTMIKKYQDGASRQLNMNVVKRFLSKINNLQPYQKLVSFDNACRNSLIMKNGKVSKQQLEQFYLSIGFSQSETNNIMNHNNFMHELIGQTDYEINFSSSAGNFQTLYDQQKINQMLTFKSLPTNSEKQQIFSAFIFQTSKGDLSKLQRYGQSKSVKIYSLYQLQFDTQTAWNFEKPQNFIIISPLWKAVKPVSIMLNGENGLNFTEIQPHDVPNQSKADLKQNGKKGQIGNNGDQGNNGSNGGNFYLLSLKRLENISNISIFANGGNGGNGQNGGNGGMGGEGGDGGKGATGGRIKFNQDYYNGRGVYETTIGGQGGDGGDSGMIGDGGYGGKKGNIVLSTSIDLMPCFTINNSDGKSGSIGHPGRQGSGNTAGLAYIDIRKTIDTPRGSRTIYIEYLMDPEKRGQGSSGKVTTTINTNRTPNSQQTINYASQINLYYKFLLNNFKNKDISKEVSLIILSKMLGDQNEFTFKNNSPKLSKIWSSYTPKNSTISKSFFNNRLVLQENEKSKRNQPLIQQQQQLSQNEDDRKKFIQRIKSNKITQVSLASPENQQEEVQRLMVGVKVLFSLWKGYYDKDQYQLAGKQLEFLYEVFLEQIVYKNKSFYFDYDQINQQAIQAIYLLAFNSLCSLKSTYTVINFDYLSYLYNDEIVEYRAILENKRKEVKLQQYSKNILDKIDTAKRVTEKFQQQIQQLIGQFDQDIKKLIQEMDKAQKQKEQYVRQLQKQSVLKGITSVLKIGGTIASYFGPFGQAIGGGLGLFGGMIDVFTPQMKPVTFKDLNPASYITIQNKEYALSTKQFILSLDDLREYKDTVKIPSKDDLIKQSEKDKNAFLKKYSQIIKNEYQDVDLKLENKDFIKKMKDAGKLSQAYDQLQTLRYSVRVGNAVQTANNILTGFSDVRNSLNEIDKARKISEQFSKTKVKIIQFINARQQKLNTSLLDMNSTLQKTNSRATLSFLQYSFNKDIDEIQLFAKSTFSNFIYDQKDKFLGIFKKFSSVNSTLVEVYKQILDLQDQIDLANFIVNVSSSTLDINQRYKGFNDLQLQLQQNILMKQANNILNGIKQSTFPSSSYFSYESYRSNLKPQKDSIQSLINKIRLAYKQRNLNKYSIGINDKYTIEHKQMVFSTITNSSLCQYLLKGQKVNIFPDIRLSDYYRDSMKFESIRIQFSLKNPQNDPNIEALSRKMQQHMAGVDVQMSSSGIYYYRFNNKYYKITGPLIDISQSYLTSENRLNIEYKKIKSGDTIFSPFTNWFIGIVNEQKPQVNLYDILSQVLGDQIKNVQLKFIGDGIYIDTLAFGGKALKDIKIDKSYEQFSTDLSEMVVNVTFE